MPSIKLTKKAVDEATHDGSAFDGKPSRFVMWDTEIPGFGLRANPGGTKSFVLSYKHQRRKRLITLGRYGVLTVTQARDLAKRRLIDLYDGKDPMKERRRESITVAQLAELYLERYASVEHKDPAKTAQKVRGRIVPRLGHLLVGAIQKKDIEAAKRDMKDSPQSFSWVLMTLKVMFRLAEEWEYRPKDSNPCDGIKKPKAGKRERYLSGNEIARLSRALQELEESGEVSVWQVAAVRLLIFTGCRKGEVLGMQWDKLDIERSKIKLTDSKTGEKDVLLSAPALQVIDKLRSLKTEGAIFIIEGRNPDRKPLSNIKQWHQILEVAGIEDLVIHDLRHTFASFGLGRRIDLRTIGHLLGHAHAATTDRYAHLADDPARSALEEIAGGLAAAMDGRKEAEVIDIRTAS